MGETGKYRACRGGNFLTPRPLQMERGLLNPHSVRNASLGSTNRYASPLPLSFWRGGRGVRTTNRQEASGATARHDNEFMTRHQFLIPASVSLSDPIPN